MKTILETERLLLRELTGEDTAFLIELLGDPDVMRYWPHPLDEAEAEEWLERQLARYERDGCGYWAACLKTGEPVGQAGLMRIEIGGTGETALGYIIRKEDWGRGFATEAALGCIDYAFTTLKLERVIAPLRPENVVSERVAVKLGMYLEGYSLFAGYRHAIYVAAK
jgi:RimJ/RimL family protein N-acetyltransferase